MLNEVTESNVRKFRLKVGVALVSVLVLAGLLVWQVPVLRFGWATEDSQSILTKYEKDVHVRFNMEIYDIIVDNYWQAVDEAELAELFRLSLSQAAGGVPAVLSSTDRSGVAKMISTMMKRTSTDKRKGLAVDTGIIVLDNLYPQGRSGLLSEKQETAFRDVVGNINRDRDLYSSLGLSANANRDEIEQAIEGREEDEEAVHAYNVLSNENTRAIYDETKMEPSISARQTDSNSLYLDMRSITPASFQEVVVKLEDITETNKPAGIIIDLRGNVGGALDFARFFFALFAGPNQYAYDLFQKGELMVERTPAIARLEPLAKIEDIAILTDGQTQSTAELMSAVFKKFKLAKIVGTTTLGWGTVENTFPIKTVFDDTEKYSVLLVHSLTLRDDGEAIETRGVDPHVDISESGWQSRVPTLFKSPAFSRDVVQLLEDKAR
jgi:C-terminal processing protease CtpA/Prc